MYREGLKSVLASAADLQVVGEAGTARGAFRSSMPAAPTS